MRGLGHQLTQQLQPLRHQLGGEKVTPVTLPPGRLRLATRPALTGSPAAREDDRDRRGRGLGRERRSAVRPTITATRRRTKSAASAGSRSY